MKRDMMGCLKIVIVDRGLNGGWNEMLTSEESIYMYGKREGEGSESGYGGGDGCWSIW